MGPHVPTYDAAMHSRNPYKIPPDFSALAEYYPPLKPFVTSSVSGKPFINFQDPDAQRALTRALLKRDFKITLTLPENRLCPTVPNRLNYILWLQDVLFPFDESKPNERIRGLDIGTGASAIYPILACTLSPSTQEWSFVGTEIDPLSASVASKNVEVNDLSSRIKIWPIIPSSPPTTENREPVVAILAPLIEESESMFDFTMCNPPFYSSTSEIEDSAEGKELPPNAVCTGAETEMITPGGEAAFVLRMVRESAREDVRQRCRWFTSMLGKLSSIGAVVDELRKLKINNYGLTQFIQGTTRRWAVGWTFGDERLPDAIARPTSSSLSPYIPASTTLRQSFVIPSTGQTKDHSMQSPYDAVRSSLYQVLESIDGLAFHEFDDVEHSGEYKIDVKAFQNTWSRAARRKRKRSRSPSPSRGRILKVPRLDSSQTLARNPSLLDDTNSDPRAVLHCYIKLSDASSDRLSFLESEASPLITLEIQWVRGLDRSLFEGFWSHLCRKVKDKIVSISPV